MGRNQIDHEKVLGCVNNSFKSPEEDSELSLFDMDNVWLQQDVQAEADLGIFLHPGLTINNITYKGYLEGEDVHNAICASLQPKPRNCRNPFEDMVDGSGEFEHSIKLEEEKERQRLRYRQMREQNRVRKITMWTTFGFIFAI